MVIQSFLLLSDFNCRYGERRLLNSRNIIVFSASSTFVDGMLVSSSNWMRLWTRSYIPTNTSAMLTMAASELIFILSPSLPLSFSPFPLPPPPSSRVTRLSGTTVFLQDYAGVCWSNWPSEEGCSSSLAVWGEKACFQGRWDKITDWVKRPSCFWSAIQSTNTMDFWHFNPEIFHNQFDKFHKSFTKAHSPLLKVCPYKLASLLSVRKQ